MKKKLGLLLLLPITLCSCGKGASFERVKALTDELSDAALFPYYRVVGTLDFNNEVLQVDEVFDKTPDPTTFVPYARFNEGFYCPAASTAESNLEDKDVVIYAMSSRSYWLRAPMRITKSNFYVEDAKGNENKTCAHYIISHIITSFMDEGGAINPSSNKMIYNVNDDGSFSFEGKASHTEFRIDNYPYYPDVATHPELDEWDPDYPLPCFKNQVNAKVNVKLEYDKDGWLVKETLKTTDYNYKKAIPSQVALEAVYTYKFA